MIYKKIFFNYEKEEKWLNEMAMKGFNFQKYTFCKYQFETGLPGEYIYRLEFLKNDIHHPESQKYMDFLQDSQVEYVSSFGRWVYFRKKAEFGSFEIYTDSDSKIAHYKRFLILWEFILLLNFILGIQNLVFGLIKLSTSFYRVNLILSGVGLGFSFILLLICIHYIRVIHRIKKEQRIHNL